MNPLKFQAAEIAIFFPSRPRSLTSTIAFHNRFNSHNNSSLLKAVSRSNFYVKSVIFLCHSRPTFGRHFGPLSAYFRPHTIGRAFSAAYSRPRILGPAFSAPHSRRRILGPAFSAAFSAAHSWPQHYFTPSGVILPSRRFFDAGAI